MVRPWRRRAAVTVELALALPVLMYLLFGLLEFGPLIRDYLTCLNAAREGARVAAVGAPTAAIIERIQQVAVGLDQTKLEIELEYRTWSGGQWSDWMPLSDIYNGWRVENSAPPGAQIRVTVRYPHKLVTGLFAYLADDPVERTRTVGARVIMTREGGVVAWSGSGGSGGGGCGGCGGHHGGQGRCW